MVFKPLSHLARRSTKAFAHGYAQSLAAASQSSNPFGPYHNHRYTNQGAGTRRRDVPNHTTAPTASFSRGHLSEANLDPFVSALQKHQHDEESQPILSSREGGWRNARTTRIGDTRTEAITSPLTIESAHATKPKQSDARSSKAESLELTSGSPYLEDQSQSPSGSPQEVGKSSRGGRSGSNGAEDFAVDGRNKTGPRNNDALSKPHSVRSDPSLQKAATRGLDENQAEEGFQQVRRLSVLASSQRYAEIPATFQSVLDHGLVPPIEAFNSLLTATTKLSGSHSETVPRALDVYQHILHLGVRPDVQTYSILVGLLATRALEAARMKPLLRRNRLRYGGHHQVATLPLPSSETQENMANEETSLNTAIRLYKLATADLQQDGFAPEAYSALIEACAVHGEVDQMIQVYAHMEEHEIATSATLYPPMIRAFAASGDLRSAVECYNEYKRQVMDSFPERCKLTGRSDSAVYAAVVASYLRCDRSSGAQRFFEKITAALEPYDDALQETLDTLVPKAFVPSLLEQGRFHEALEILDQEVISPPIRDAALDEIAAAAADGAEGGVALKAHRLISAPTKSQNSLFALLALHLRNDHVDAARHVWRSLSHIPNPDKDFIEPAIMYACALIKDGDVHEGLEEARRSFARSRASKHGVDNELIADLIDESVEKLSLAVCEQSTAVSVQAITALLWMMVENGGLIRPVAERLLKLMGTQEISGLDGKDLELALHVEANFIGTGHAVVETEHAERFASILSTVVERGMPFSGRTVEIVDPAVKKLERTHPGLISLWVAWNQGILDPNGLPFDHISRPASALSPYNMANESFDPYAKDLDLRGSSIIVDELEKSNGRPSSSLNESLARFRNIRRAGRHPRYITYARLIGAAAKERRSGLISDIYEMAKHDMPYLSQFPAVRHGWTSIFDAMVGAYLTVGNRPLAAGYHERLLQIGAAPTANTYGLYITTLKDSTKMFDEASEAVHIFRRAKSEGVEPTPFLYNALIGKLGKARRIDDCLFYFAEMRARGLRPTSVTYGTIVNALCRVSDERFAQDLFDEMESMHNYKPRPAPYNSMMQFFLTTKRDSSKVLEYYQRMQSRGIKSTMHTYKLLIDTYATLEPINLAAAEGVLETISSSGQSPDAVHFASLIHAKGCVLQDMAGAKAIFDEVSRDSRIRPQPCLYQAYFESMVANHCVRETGPILEDMLAKGVEMTAYIGNTLIHGWTLDRNINAAKAVYDSIGREKREPSTYEAMTRGFLAAERRESASEVVQEMIRRGYPAAVSGKILELLSHRVPSEPPMVPSIAEQD